MSELRQWHVDRSVGIEFNRCDCHLHSPCGCYDSEWLAWSLCEEFEPGKTGVECLECGATWASYDDE